MLSEEELKTLEDTHKRVAHIVGKNNAWEIVLRKPTRAEYKRFRSMATNETQKADAQETLARSCVVHPTREAFDALLEDYPAAADACASSIMELVGLVTEESTKY